MRDKGKWICNICDKEFAQGGSLNTHKKSHMNNKLNCSICNATLKNRNSLQSHKLNTHEKSNYIECHICKRKVERHKMTNHLNFHNGIKPHKCLECDYSATNKVYLSKHTEKYHLNN